MEKYTIKLRVTQDITTEVWAPDYQEAFDIVSLGEYEPIITDENVEIFSIEESHGAWQELVNYITGLIEDRLGIEPNQATQQAIFESATILDGKDDKSFIYFMVHEIQNGYHIEEFKYPLEKLYQAILEQWEGQSFMDKLLEKLQALRPETIFRVINNGSAIYWQDMGDYGIMSLEEAQYNIKQMEDEQ